MWESAPLLSLAPVLKTHEPMKPSWMIKKLCWPDLISLRCHSSLSETSCLTHDFFNLGPRLVQFVLSCQYSCCVSPFCHQGAAKDQLVKPIKLTVSVLLCVRRGTCYPSYKRPSHASDWNIRRICLILKPEFGGISAGYGGCYTFSSYKLKDSWINRDLDAT